MSQITVLVVDADDSSRNFLSRILRNYDFKVVEAKSATEALQKASETPPGIVSCDANIPDLLTYEFIERLRSEKSFVSVPIVVFSADPDPEEMDRCTKAGANEYYGKSGGVINAFAKNIMEMIMEMKQVHPEEEKEGVLGVFISAKGGTGTSSICANTAMSLSTVMRSSTVAVVDMVLPIGSQALITGCENDFDIVTLSQLEPDQITNDYLYKYMVSPKDWNFKLLCGSPNPGKAGEFNVQHTPDIIKALRKAYDYVLVDFGRSLSRISLPIVQEADVAVLVLAHGTASC